jgi:hypothetical protein
MHRYDAAGYINESGKIYDSRGMDVTTDRQQGFTSSVGNSKVTVSLPPAFDPVRDKWLLWKPQVKDYFVMVGLPGILDPVEALKLSLQANRIALGTIKATCPPHDAAHISTCGVKFAYKACQMLESAYGSRSELDLQKMLSEFEVAKQQSNETIRAWTTRLDRMVTELNLLANLAAKENSTTLDSSDTCDAKAVSEMSHKHRLLNVRVEDQPHAAFIAALCTEIYTLHVKEVEARLITYDQGKEIQNALNSSTASGTSSFFTNDVGGLGEYARTRVRGAGCGYGRDGGNRAVAGRTTDIRICCACGGAGHNFRKCITYRTPEGRQRLLAQGVYWNPAEFRPVTQPSKESGAGAGRAVGRVEKRPQATQGELEWHADSFPYVTVVKVTVELNTAKEVVQELVPAQQQGTNLVLIDSGAGGVVFSDVNMFTGMNPPSTEAYIQFGTGPRIPVKGVGAVCLCFTSKDAQKVYKVCVKGAYYVPQQPLNIISTRAIMSLGWAAIFDGRFAPQCVRWATADGDIFQAMIWRSNLPFTQCPVDGVPVNAMRRAIPRDLEYDVTHAAFGHMSPGKLQRLAAEGYIDTSKASHDDSHACAACNGANASLESYRSVHDLAATYVNHTLHTNLLHFPVPTVS